MRPPPGWPLPIAALVLVAGILAASYVLRASLERAAAEVAGLRADLRELAPALERALEPPAPPGARARGPDPGRRYRVDTEGAPARGPSDAPVSLVEFADFQCPFCARVDATLRAIRREYGDRVRIVFKHLPLAGHAGAPEAHAAAEAAHRQGRFWKMHDALLAGQGQPSPERYLAYAREIGLDVERFERDVRSAAVRERIRRDVEEAARLGVRSTPAFFVNGRYLLGAQPIEVFRGLIDEELAGG